MPDSRIRWLGCLAVLCLASFARAAEPLEVVVSSVVDVAPERAWALMSDFSLAHNYVPGLTRTEITTEATRGVGASRRVYDEDGDYLEETITVWDEGEGFAIWLHRGDESMTPFTRAEFRYHMTPLGAASTRVTLAIVAGLPLGSFGAWLGDWIVRPTMEDELTQVAAGLKHFYETGTPATDADRERLAGAVSVALAAAED